MNIKRTKVMTTEEKHDFNTDSRDTKIGKDFAYVGSVNHSHGDQSHEIKRRLRLRGTATEELSAKMCH